MLEMPMKTARSRLPAQVQDFLEAFATTGDGKAAAISVGVHPRVAGRFVRETMDHPDAAEAFNQILRTRFSHARPLALSLLVDMVQNKTYEPRVRLEAARTILVRADAIDKAPAQGAKDLHELSRDELARIVDQGEQELASRAKLVGNMPVDDAIDVQVIDLEA